MVQQPKARVLAYKRRHASLAASTFSSSFVSLLLLPTQRPLSVCLCASSCAPGERGVRWRRRTAAIIQRNRETMSGNVESRGKRDANLDCITTPFVPANYKTNPRLMHHEEEGEESERDVPVRDWREKRETLFSCSNVPVSPAPCVSSDTRTLTQTCTCASVAS